MGKSIVLMKNSGHAVHVPIISSGEGTWTPDRADMSRLLYHLSYAAKIITWATIPMNAFGVKLSFTAAGQTHEIEVDRGTKECV